MKRKYNRKPAQQLKIAKQRIIYLFNEADKIFNSNSELASRYVEIARNISMKYKVKIPSELKKHFCCHCYKYVRPGINLRVRLYRGRLVYYCLLCKKHYRFPYRKINKKLKICSSK